MDDPNPKRGVSHWELTLLVRDLRARADKLEERSREQDQLIANLLVVNARINSENDRLRSAYGYPMGNQEQCWALARAIQGEPVFSWRLKDGELIVPEIEPPKKPHSIWEHIRKNGADDEEDHDGGTPPGAG